MTSKASTPEEYIAEIPEERVPAMEKLRQTIKDNLPEGFEEQMIYGMIGYVVPLSTYPDGYHCSPELPLTFINIASQKNFIAIYHSGIYANEELLNWFVDEYPKHVKTKLDMGKSCIRFKKPDQIPMELVAELCQKMTLQEWVNIYEKSIKR